MELIVSAETKAAAMAEAVEAMAAPVDREAIRRARQAAFEAETDPMAFEVMRGEASIDDYKARVAEIRARYPYPKE